MKKKRGPDVGDVPREIREALARFPQVVRRKTLRYRARQRFLRETFGPLVKQLLREQRRASRR